MKKLILLTLITLIMIGCTTRDSNSNIIKNSYDTHYVLIIDSCEYIKRGYGMSHKGKCRFCEERDSVKWEKRKKELEELIVKKLK